MSDARGPVAWRFASLILLAIAAGILTGLAEAAFLQSQRIAFGRIVFMGRHAWWMKPLAEGALFAGIVGAWSLLTIARPRLRSVRVIASGLAGLATLSLLLMIPQLHLAAKLVLAIALGFQAGALFERFAGRHERTARRFSAAAVAGLALVCAVSLFRPASDRGDFASSAAADAPNILLLMLDTVRARSLSAYGRERPTTPVLERLAAEGVLFERAISPAPWTLPAHASMFTGRWPHELTADWRVPLDDEHATLAEHLASAGYETAGFVANMGYCGWETGLDRGFRHYEDTPVSVRQIAVESSIVSWLLRSGAAHAIEGRDENFVRKSAADVNRSFLRWLDDAPQGPFFAFLNYYDAHGPYQPPEPYRSTFAIGGLRGPDSPLHRWLEDPFQPPPGADDIQRELGAYEGAIAALDAEIGRLLEDLEARGLLERTVVIVTADHGEEFGKRGAYDHGNSLYLDGLHVPLVVRYPERLPAGGRVPEVVSLRRLAATVADLAGTGADAFPGASLIASADAATREPVLSSVSFAPRLPDWFPVSRGDMASVTSDRWHLIRNGDGILELYDMGEGPVDAPDRSADPSLRPVLDSLSAALAPGPGSP